MKSNSFYNKKVLLNTIIVLSLVVFFVPIFSVSATECEKNSKQSYFLSVFNPIISFAEKTLKGFGYDVTLAAAPDPDICGNDSVGCSGTTPTATISWEPAPEYYYSDWMFSIINTFCLYKLSVGGIFYDVPYNQTSHTVSSGLSPNTTYDWSVKAGYIAGAGPNRALICGSYNLARYLEIINFDNEPSGKFTTPSCQTLTVDLTANPTSGDAPLINVWFNSIIGGTAQGTINYHFWWDCNNTTTNISQAEALCGALPNPTAGNCIENAFGSRCLSLNLEAATNWGSYHSYLNTGVYKPKVIIERGTASSAQDQEDISVIIPVNNPPTATNLLVVKGNYCTMPSHYFSWIYSDPDGDPESRFDFQVDNNSGFGSPEINRTVNNPSINNQTVIVSVPTIVDQLNYNTTYYWRVRVYDGETDSGWVSGSSFTTELHKYPDVDFSWNPSQPAIDQEVIFTDLATVYSSTKSAWAWTFPGGNPASSSVQNPTVKFGSVGDNQITLQVTDSNGYTCSDVKNLRVDPESPDWQEK